MSDTKELRQCFIRGPLGQEYLIPISLRDTFVQEFAYQVETYDFADVHWMDEYMVNELVDQTEEKMSDEKPLELTINGGDEVVAYACPRCRCVTGKTADSAMTHYGCFPRICECGAECTRGWTACDPCRARKEESRERERYEKAEKIQVKNWRGPVYHEPTDTYHRDAHYVLDELSEGETPTGVWACDVLGFEMLDAYDLLESSLTESTEDAAEQLDIDGLQKLLDTWRDEQVFVSWSPNYKKAIVYG